MRLCYLLTIGDFYKQRYGKGVEVLTSVAIVASYLGWTSAQLTALGLVIHVLSGGAIDFNNAILIGAGVVLVYTIFGGMWSVAFTDLFQTIVILIGLSLVAVLVGPVIVFAGSTLMLHESRTIYRQIFTDGRKLPKDAQPTWMGYSIGHWEGDTFVVETSGFRGDGSWLDNSGHPHTEALKLTERFRRVNFGQLELDVTIDDPKAYTKPWTVVIKERLLVDVELIDEICLENEKSLVHMK